MLYLVLVLSADLLVLLCLGRAPSSFLTPSWFLPPFSFSELEPQAAWLDNFSKLLLRVVADFDNFFMWPIVLCFLILEFPLYLLDFSSMLLLRNLADNLGARELRSPPGVVFAPSSSEICPSGGRATIRFVKFLANFLTGLSSSICTDRDRSSRRRFDRWPLWADRSVDLCRRLWLLPKIGMSDLIVVGWMVMLLSMDRGPPPLSTSCVWWTLRWRFLWPRRWTSGVFLPQKRTIVT